MSTEFDAYHKWLGISPREQPPSNYRLLAIDLFEDDRTGNQDADPRRGCASLLPSGSGGDSCGEATASTPGKALRAPAGARIRSARRKISTDRSAAQKATSYSRFRAACRRAGIVRRDRDLLQPCAET